jgi:hypothetical protein
VRVLFVYDNGATEYGTNTDMIEHAINRVNAANNYLVASDASRWLEIEYAGFYRWNSNPDEKLVLPLPWRGPGYQNLLKYNISSYLEKARTDTGIKNKQIAYAADVVAVITDDPYESVCGRANTIGATSYEQAYFIVDDGCFYNSLTFAHELGHLLGMRHDRARDSNSTPYVYGHGHFSRAAKKRTIMSYNCEGSNCTRMGFFSNPNIHYPGTNTDAGTYGYEYNTKVLRYRAPVISRLR